MVALPALDAIPHPEIESLVAGAIAGDTSSFEALYQRDAARVYNLVLRSCGEPAEAEDICQEIWTRVHRSLRSLRDASAFDTWVVRIAARVCIDAARRRHIEYDETALLKLQDASDVADMVEEQEHRHLAWQALAALAPRQRLALYLREVDGLRYADIAEALETTPSAVETLLFRARQALAQAYGRLADSPGERCQRARQLMSVILDGEGDAAEQRSLKAHLGDCRTCQRHMSALNRGRRGYAALPFVAATGTIAPVLLPAAGGAGLAGALIAAGRIAALFGKATSLALPAVTAATVTVAAAVSAEQPRSATHAANIAPPSVEAPVTATIDTPVVTPGTAGAALLGPQPGSLQTPVTTLPANEPPASSLPQPGVPQADPAGEGTPFEQMLPPDEPQPPQGLQLPPVTGPVSLPPPALPVLPPLQDLPVVKDLPLLQDLTSLPPITLPPVITPQISTPAIALPQVATPPLSTPPLNLPAVQLPQVAGLPPLTVPSVQVPQINVPSVTVPSVQVPSVQVPSVQVPQPGLPPTNSPQSTAPPLPLPNVTVPVQPLLPRLPVTVPQLPPGLPGLH